MLVLCTIETFKLGILLSLFEKETKVYCYPSLNWLTFAQYKHDPNVMAMRVNGQITEVNQSRPWLILRWVTI